jgi:hypothetical protein
MTLLLAVLAVLIPRPAVAGAYVHRGFLSRPTDQIGIPGIKAGAEITPEGDLYTGWAEYEPRFGSHLKAWDQPSRTLPDPLLPEFAANLSEGAVRYTLTVFATVVGGRPIAYLTLTATNTSTQPRKADVAMDIAYTRGRQVKGVHGIVTGAYRFERPAAGQPVGFYTQPGEPFSAAFHYTTSGRDLLRSGLLLARGPAAPSHSLSPSHADTPTTAHDGRAFQHELPGHGRASFTWQIPLEPPAAGTSADAQLDAMPLARARMALVHEWDLQEAPMMRIGLPEREVTATYDAAIVEMLESRERSPLGWVQASNKLQYDAFWIRDAAMETFALDLSGLHEPAAQDLAFMDTFQQPDGLFISRAGQYDGLGQALWAISEHAQLTGSADYATEQLPRIGAAVGFLSAATSSDPLGLMPGGNPEDDELADGHITGDDLWAAAGLRSAVTDATLAGRSDLAAAWQTVDTRFEASLKRALSSAVKRAGHIPPVLDASGGQDWGNYYASYPVQVLPPRDPMVAATIRWARAHSVQGLPTYANGTSLHDYLGFSLFQTELAAGEPEEALAGLYAELAHTTSTDEGWEWDVPPWGPRASAVDLSPHGTFAGDYVALVRNMLLEEDPSGSIMLLSGASPAWLAPGEHIAVTQAPTGHGVVSFVEHSSAHGESLRWTSSLPPGTRLSWKLPWWAQRARDASGQAVGSVIPLPGSSGRLRVTFTGRRPRLSYASAAAALNASYRAHGLPAPLVAAAR